MLVGHAIGRWNSPEKHQAHARVGTATVAGVTGCETVAFAVWPMGDGRKARGFHPKPAEAHTSSPLFVSLQEDEAMIIAHRVSCLERSSGYVGTIFGWSVPAPPQVA
eukprot:4234037-Prymnesium_polylepis.1